MSYANDGPPWWVIILVMVSVLMLIGSGVALVNAVVCDSKWSKAGIPHSWTLFEGCMIKTKEGWIPAENYRVLD